MESPDRTWVSERRRGLLQLFGAATTGGVLTDAGDLVAGDASFRLVQDGECVPLEPLSGSEPVERFYAYQLPSGKWTGDNGARDDGGPYYSSLGTDSLQRHDTSLLFLYDGPNGLSLVVVHGKIGESPNGGGSASFAISGLPDGGSWVVKDDLYLDPETGEQAATNYDRWAVDGEPQRIDWTWGGNTDGGAFRGLGEGAEVTVDPAFNGDAALYEQHYSGDVTAWQALSGSASSPERHDLDMTKPVTIAAGSCDGTTTSPTPTETATDTPTPTEDGGGATDDSTETETETETESETKTETETERSEDREARKEEREQRKHERKQRKHEKKEERKQRKHQRKQRKHERKRAEKEEREQRKHERK